ncbi:homoserine kinase [Parvularcula marina]|uniref:Homoserine kinase n=1 Tax=Parvularcula marina TaxID=2292771 RepID=A0A371RHJ8_9PROT|nr:homoserine kinase [Parvularcula marina]RFB04905.1 homoserine kinase [Parvularcula marina]
MAVYTHVSREELEDFLTRYDLPPLVAHHGIEAGVENSNYFLDTEDGRYVLTLFEKRVAEEDLPYFLGLTEHLRQKGMNVPAPIHLKDGDMIGQLCGRPAAIVTFLQGVSEKSANLAQARAAGTLLAQFHLSTDGFEPERANDLGPADWALMVKGLGDGLNKIELGLFGNLRAEAEHLMASWPSQLPRGQIHADFFPDNVMFDGDSPAGVIDFYFACTDFFAYDLAIAMNAFTAEDAPSPDLGMALMQGYETVRPLSREEKEALPLFWRGSALRFALTRAHDFIHQVPGSLVQVKDPKPWLALLGAHRQSPGFFSA